MRLKKEDSETLVYAGFTVITLIALFSVFQIRDRGSISESPRLLPLLVVVLMFVLSISGLIHSLRKKGAPTPGKIWESVKQAAENRQNRGVVWSICIVSLYIFVGIPLLGYYVSSFLVTLFICLVYVKRVKPIVSLLYSVLLTAGLYAIFAVAFQLSLR